KIQKSRFACENACISGINPRENLNYEVNKMARKMFMRLLPLAIAVGMVLTGLTAAQNSGTGNITGVVSDANGAVVKGATVALTSKETNLSQTTTTNDDGIYNFVLLKPGSYEVKTTAASFGASTLAVEVY